MSGETGGSADWLKPPQRPIPPFTAEVYEALRGRTFGASNPERQANPVWEWLVRTLATPYGVCSALGIERDFALGDPYWCFQRFGATRTQLPDGRVVYIAGEHEDSYDPDFCIYNDVIVLRPSERDLDRAERRRREREEQRRLAEEDSTETEDDVYEAEFGASPNWGGRDGHPFDGDIEIFGYPREVFPPTDFHTATRVGDRIILIGNLGYRDERTPGVTPVMSLHLGTMRIEHVPTTGDPPGWVYKHTAVLEEGEAERSSILVRGGKVEVQGKEGQETHDQIEEFRLHLSEMRWERITDRSAWRQFDVRLCVGPDGYRPALRTFEMGPGTTAFEQVQRSWRAPETRELWQLAGMVCVPRRINAGWQHAAAEIEGVPVRARRESEGYHIVIEAAADGQLVERIIALFVENAARGHGQAFEVREL